MREVLGMSRSIAWALLGVGFCTGLIAACSDGSVVSADNTGFGGENTGATTSTSGGSSSSTGGVNDTAGGASSVPPGLGVGDDCSSDACRAGLVCNDKKVCEPGGMTAAGDPCVLGAECKN